MKKIILVLFFVLTLFVGLDKPIKQAKAKETCTAVSIAKTDGIYDIREKQSELDNFIPSQALKNTSVGTCTIDDGILFSVPDSTFSVGLKYLYFFIEYQSQSGPEKLLEDSASGYCGYSFTLNGVIKGSFSNEFSVNHEQTLTKKLSELLESGLDNSADTISLYDDNIIEIKVDISLFTKTITLGSSSGLGNFRFTLDSNNKYGLVKRGLVYASSDLTYSPKFTNPQYGEQFVCMSGPYFNNSNKDLIYDIDCIESTKQILDRIKVYDEGDGLVDFITIEDTYSDAYLNRQIGTYKLTLEASDNAGNVSRLYLNIILKDFTRPVLNGPEIIDISYADKNPKQTILDKYSVSDNYDKNPVMSIYNPKDYQFNVISKFVIQIIATDSSSNNTSKDVTINVIDDVPPVILGPDKLNVLLKDKKTLSELLENYSANDEIDNFITPHVEKDNYTKNQTKVGTYQVTISATDNSGNISYKIIDITITDTEAPLWYVDDISITVSNLQQIEAIEIVNVLKDQNFIQKSEYKSAKYIKGDYYENYSLAGDYYVVILAINIDEQTIEFPITIHVVDKTIKKESNISFFKNILAFFKNIWLIIKQFFERILRYLHFIK